jgi:hypothetical protein
VGPAGPSGQAAGKILYLATSDPSDIATYKTGLTSPSAGAEQTVSTVTTGTNTDFLVAVFATDPGVIGAVDFPAGTSFRRIYASTNGTSRFHLQVYIRNAAGTETLVRDEFSPNFTDSTVTMQEWIATTSSAGALLATDRIVAKLYAQRITGGGGTVTVTTYFEGSSHTSQVQTTITAGAQGPAGPTGPTGATGPAGPGVPVGGTTGQVLAKTSGTDYATAWTTPVSPVQQTEFFRTGAMTTGVGGSDGRIWNLSGVTRTLINVGIALGTAPTGAAFIADLNKNGTTIFTTQGNRPSIAAAANYAASGTPDVTTWAHGDYITLDRDQIGSTVAGSDLTGTIFWRY